MKKKTSSRVINVITKKYNDALTRTAHSKDIL
ncbi:hypothetical protein EYZ11_009681 [Aspergillus tanneri]|uniref:Uncharacterized protein n=1 Tax=Aspergillus tanneri TaxID=1220188 RepID=A0A4S3J7G4_9EURO|nr:hypothetical protein EYZ11_009681 [Aspergillus tanneri]